MCHSSVIIRKHIDLTITLEQHSPAPQSRYLSPGGTWSDEAGSELFLGLCFTPYAVFAPPLASLFFLLTSFFPLLYSLLTLCSISHSHSAFCPLRFCQHTQQEAKDKHISCPTSGSADTAAAPGMTRCFQLHTGRLCWTHIPASPPACV